MKTKTTCCCISNLKTFNFFFLALTFLLGANSIANAQLLQWNTFGNLGTETTEPSVFNDVNITGPVNLTLGSVTASANGNRFGGSGWFNTGNTVTGNTLAEAVAGNDYIQFIVTPNGGFSFTPTSLVFTWDRSGTGPSSVTLRSSADGFTADLGTVTGMVSGGAATTTPRTIVISTLTNITVATTFRLYGYGATATGGTGGFDNATSVVDVQLNGTTALSCTSPTLAINSTTSTCTGTFNGAIDINVSGGTPPFTYLWSNSATTEDIVGVAAGTYTVTVTSTGGCSATISASVNSIVLPTVSYTGLSAAVCINASSLTLTGNQSPAGTFTGNGITDNGNGSAAFNPATAGVGGPYNITYSYTDIGTGCSNLQTQTVTVNDVPNLGAISPVSNTCPVVSFDLSSITLSNTGASGASTYFATLSDANSNINSISSSVSVSGTYFIRVTTVQGCFDVEPVVVTINSCGCPNPPTANAGSNFSICANANAQVNGTIGGGATSATWSGGAGSFSPDANTVNAIYTPTAGEITAGSVTLTLTTDDPDAGGPCVAAVSSVTITINVLPPISVNPVSAAICIGSSTGTITASGASTYTWAPSDGSLSATTGATVIANPLSTTTYTVTGTDVNGCQNTTSITVTVNALPGVSVNPNSTSICFGGATGIINAGGASAYTWANAGGLSATTGSAVTANPTSTTTYTVTGTDANGCSSTATLLVTINALPTVAITGSNIICSGSSTTLDAGSGFSSYLWSDGTTTQTISASAAGTYTVTVTDANGCSNSTSKTLTVSSSPSLSATATPSNCNTSVPGTIDLTVTGGTPCNANAKGLIISKISANPGGTDSPFEFVELVATRDIDFSVTPYTVIFNNNGTATSNGWVAGGALTYAFQISSGTAFAGGVYYVGGDAMPATGNRLRAINTATTAGDGGIGNAAAGGVLGNGGTSADAVAVFNLPAALVTSSSVPVDAIFFGNTAMGTAVVSGGTQGYQLPVNDHYAGGKLQSGSFFIGGDIFAVSDRLIVATGTYDVQSNSFTTPRTFANNSLLLFTEGATSVSLANTQAYFYNWSNSATTQDIAGLTAGDYTVTVIDCNGCSATISKTVANVAPPVVGFTGLPSNLCASASAVTLTGSNAPSGIFSGTGITDNANGTATFNPAAAGTGGPYSITYSYIDPSTGCTGTQSQNITVDGLPDIQPISPVSNTCPIPTVDLSAITIVNNGVAGTASYFATLADANNNTNSISPVVNTSGTYHIRVTTASGCYDVEPVVVTINGCGCANPPTASAGSNFSICADGTAQLNGSIGGGATSLTWSGGAGTFTPNANTANAVYTPTPSEVSTGSVTLTITTDDPDGIDSCLAATSSVIITINPLPAVTLNTNTISICSGSATGDIIAGGAITYSWSPSGGLNATTGSTVTASPAGATTYTVTGTNSNGCTNTATVAVIVNSLPSLIISPPNPSICFGSSTGLNASGATTYTWANAAGLSATTGDAVTANPASTTVYTVTGTDANGCSSATTVQVSVNQLPPVTINGSSVICTGSSAILDAGAGFVSYLWSSGETSQTISTSLAGAYTATVTDANGCSNFASKNISVANPPVISSITPNVTCLGNTGSISITPSGGTPCAVNSPGLIISKLQPNPNSTDSPFEFVELVATKDIDFSVTPYSVIFSNNGAANASGWIASGGLTYGFEISTGTATAGGVYYVGGISMIPVSNHLRAINTLTNAGDGGIGSASASGVLGNGGANADGVAVFNSNILSITASSVPVDAFFFGTGIGGAEVAGGTQGYQLPVNDIYNGGKLQSASFFGPEPVSGQFINATGTFNVLTNSYTTPRTFANSGTFTEGVSGVTVIAAAPYAYNWSTGSTSQNLSNVGAGTYTVTVTDCNGCTVSASATVSISSALKPYLQEGDSVLCSNDLGFDMHVLDSGTYAGGYPFGTTFDFYGAGAILYQTGTSNVFFNQNNSDAFYVVVSLPSYLGGCSAISDTSVIDFGSSQAPQYILSADSVKCYGGASGNATVDITFGGTANFRYQWYDSGMNNLLRDVTKSGTNDSLQNVPAGMYIVVITDHQGATTSPYCSVTDSVYIGEPLSPLSITENLAGHVDVLCNGGLTGAVDITVTGGTAPYQFSWSNGSTTEDLTGIGAGTYTVTVTDAAGCSTSIAITVTEGAPITLSISGALGFCSGNSTILNAGAGYNTYSWSTGETTQAISVNTAGSFTVTVSIANGCTASTSVTTTVNANPNPTISGASLICAASAPLDAGAGYNSYSWSNGATTQIISVNISGTYTVTVANASGCTGTASKTISISNSLPAQPGIISGPASVCKNSNATFSIAAVPGATSYTWTATSGASVSTGQGSATVVINFSNAATSASLSVVANNVCGSGVARTLAYTVSSVIPQAPATVNGPLYGLCNQTNVAYNCPLVANATSYLWSVPAGVTILTGQGTNAITVKFTGTFTGTGNISVVAQTGCGNSAATTRTLNAKPQQPVISGQNWACKNQPGLVYSVAPVAGASSYTWTVVAGSTLVSGQGTTSIVVNWGSINGVITCKANNSCGSSTVANKPVSFTCKEEGSLFDFSDISLFPNPASTSVTVQFDGFAEGKGYLSVYDLLGKQLLKEEMPVLNGNNQFNIDLSKYPKGSYTVKVVYNGYTRNCKLIVQ